MNIRFSEQAWDEYLYWQQNDRAMVRRVNQLIREIRREPFSGVGQPEALRFQWSGYWSRRLDQEHRLVYRIVEGELEIAQGRYHYRAT